MPIVDRGVTQVDLDNLKLEMVSGFNSLGHTLSAEFAAEFAKVNQRFDRVEARLQDLDASFRRHASDTENAINSLKA